MTSPVDNPTSGSDTFDAAEHAYTRVLAMIGSGEIAAGTWLRETTLAASIGVSRTPIREALNRLGAEGVVELSRNRGAQVVSFSASDSAALLDMRATIEPEVVRAAVPRMSSADHDRLAGLSEAMETVVRDGSSPTELTALNTEFHGLFLERCGNRHLITAMQSVMRPAIVIRTFRQYNERELQRSMNHHAELVDAARLGDAEWAAAVMRAHLLAARHVTVVGPGVS